MLPKKLLNANQGVFEDSIKNIFFFKVWNFILYFNYWRFSFHAQKSLSLKIKI